MNREGREQAGVDSSDIASIDYDEIIEENFPSSPAAIIENIPPSTAAARSGFLRRSQSLQDSRILSAFRTNRLQERGRRMSRRMSRRRTEILPNDDHHPHRRASLLGIQTTSIVADIASDLKHECLDVKDAFVNELEHACDCCDSHFLNMSMTRTMSLPPLQVEEAVRQFQQAMGFPTTEDHGDYEVDEEDLEEIESEEMGTPLLSDGVEIEDERPQTRDVVPARPWYAYLLLAGAVLALSSIGPAMGLMTGTVPFLAAFWRLTGTSIVMLPLAMRVLTMQSCPDHDSMLGCPMHNDGALGWSWTSWLTAMLAAFAYVSIGVCFAFACEYTNIGNVLIFGNSQSILLFLGKVVYGRKVEFEEGLGVFVAISGAVLCSADTNEQAAASQHDNYNPYHTWMGDGFALLAGLVGVVYLASANALRDKVDILVYVPLNMLLCGLIVLGHITLVLHQRIAATLDPHEGLFGWLTPRFDRLWLELYIIFGCSVFGTFGYIQSMRYFDNVTISFASLLEPMIATVMAYGLGATYLPGLVGWVGNLLVVTGTIAVIYPSSHAAKQQI